MLDSAFFVAIVLSGDIAMTDPDMPRVTGIGGFFFKAKDPAALAAWYDESLGITNMNADVWSQAAGPTIFGPFSASTDYFGKPEQQFLVNFRVDDLDGFMEKLTAMNITVETRPEWNSEVGRFCRIYDPEGNPVELWEPATTLTS